MASRNADNVIFNSCEVLTLVVDLYARTRTYDKDGYLLGVLVSSLPRTGSLYSVAVLFNFGIVLQ